MKKYFFTNTKHSVLANAYLPREMTPSKFMSGDEYFKLIRVLQKICLINDWIKSARKRNTNSLRAVLGKFEYWFIHSS